MIIIDIAEIRKSKNLTQDELANKLGVDRSTVSKWETGEFLPSTKNLIELARLYDCTVDELLDSFKEGKSLEEIKETE